MIELNLWNDYTRPSKLYVSKIDTIHTNFDLGKEGRTTIYASGTWFYVKESVEEVLKLINEDKG